MTIGGKSNRAEKGCIITNRGWLVVALLLAACTAVAPLPPADEGPRIHTVRATSNGWHTAIVLDRSALAATGLLQEADDFAEAAFVEFSWGDRVYFPAREKSLTMTLDAALAAKEADLMEI